MATYIVAKADYVLYKSLHRVVIVHTSTQQITDSWFHCGLEMCFASKSCPMLSIACIATAKFVSHFSFSAFCAADHFDTRIEGAMIFCALKTLV